MNLKDISDKYGKNIKIVVAYLPLKSMSNESLASIAETLILQ